MAPRWFERTLGLWLADEQTILQQALFLEGAILFATLNILNHSVSDRKSPEYAPALQPIPHLSQMGFFRSRQCWI
jgi:hypothetical protein